MQGPPTDEVRIAIRGFCSVVEGGETQSYSAMIVALTKLMEVAARMTNEDVDQVDLAASRDILSDHKFVRSRFPNLETACPDDQDAKGISGWPHDDLGDIYHDLRGVEDVLALGAEIDARWQFRWGFEMHWGAHAVALLGYLLRTYRT